MKSRCAGPISSVFGFVIQQNLIPFFRVNSEAAPCSAAFFMYFTRGGWFRYKTKHTLGQIYLKSV